jgi:hypothetical protein
MRGTMRRLALVAGVVLAACAAAPAAHADVPTPDADPFYAVPSGLDGPPGGTVIRSRPITATVLSVPLPATAWQVLYKTVDNVGHPTATVTTIMVPTVAHAGGGPRPVVSYQTAEDGVGTKCAPSFALRGGLAAATSNSAPETAVMLLALLRGWIVVAPDYEGPQSMFLGAEGEARGVLDGLRAARAFAPAGIAADAPLALWGYSGGAFASTVAAQLQPRYAPELRLSGVALGGVVADVKATLRAFSGSALGGALAMGLVGVDRAYPEFRLTQYLSAAGHAALAASQEDCINDAALKHPVARIEQLTEDPAVIDGPALAPLFRRMNPLTFPGVPAAPVYDYHAVLDEFAPIGPDRALMDRFCREGVAVQHVEDHASEHISLIATGALGALDYLDDRVAGQAPPNTCTVPPDPAPAAAPACPAGSRKAPHATVLAAGLRVRRRSVVVRGRATAGCDRAAPRSAKISRVSVSIARAVGKRCRFVDTRGRLTAPRSCRRPLWLRAAGTARWTLTAAVLRPGWYRVDVRATDSAGRRQPLAARPAARFRLRG